MLRGGGCMKKILGFSLLLIGLSSCASGISGSRHLASPGTGGAGDASGGSIDPSKVTVLGGDESSFTPAVNASGPAIQDADQYDVVIVGSGLAGLSAATFLTDNNYKKKILILEKEDHIGGLASWEQIGSHRVDRGAAYWTDTFEEEQQILEYIGLGKWKTADPIPAPIDAYMVRGKLYRGVWDTSTLKELPASFVLFKYELEKANDEGFIPNQPFEDFNKMDLDKIDTAAWIRSMPARLAKRGDARSKKVYARYLADLNSGKLSAADPMIDVIELMDLYCRSALGTNSDKVSAMAFANFYLCELITRYTTPIGTSQAMMNMKDMLSARGGLATIKVSSPVVKITNQSDHADVRYVQNGELHSVRGQYVIFAAELKFAPRIIDGLTEQSPAQAGLMSTLGYAHYSVHNVEVQGHPYKGAYDTWSHASDYTDADPTDMITGRWLELHGYKKKPLDSDTTDVFTIYHPLPQSALGNYSKEQAAQIAAAGVGRIFDLYKPLFDPSFTSPPDWKTKNIISVTTNPWPFSVHIAEPGHYSYKVNILKKAFGRVIFAHNNLGTPAFEEALFRGHCGADQVLARMVPGFQKEPWSKCDL
jgi:phytoene dehydrogenase-like protein